MRKIGLLSINLFYILLSFSITASPNPILPTFASSCITNSSISLNESGGSTGVGEITSYVLTDLSGNILQIQSTPTFSNVPTGDYGAYAVSYETAAGATGLTIGQNIQNVSSTGCLDFSAPYSFRTCSLDLPIQPTSCNYTGITNIILGETSGSNGSNETTSYVLTDLSGNILQIQSTPTFSNVPTGDYGAYAVSYETAAGAIGLTIGQNIQNVSSTGCLDFSAPYSFRTCSLDLPILLSSCNYIGVTSVTLTETGGSNGSDETTSYILTDLTGQILQIQSTPTFSNLPYGDYGAYAVSYETTASATGLTLGQNIQNISSTGCLDFSTPYSFQTCPFPNEICNDGMDNDGDGLIDCADPDCEPIISQAMSVVPTCTNKTGGQITISATGSGVLSYSITNEENWQSSNIFPGLGVGQYTIRVRNDSGCGATLTMPVIFDVSTCIEICNDGIDNDGDGLIDCDDTDCRQVENIRSINND